MVSLGSILVILDGSLWRPLQELKLMFALPLFFIPGGSHLFLVCGKWVCLIYDSQWKNCILGSCRCVVFMHHLKHQ